MAGLVVHRFKYYYSIIQHLIVYVFLESAYFFQSFFLDYDYFYGNENAFDHDYDDVYEYAYGDVSDYVHGCDYVQLFINYIK